ncbi:AI-2E family transporter [Antarcticibacterium sp. 1MA-6-2]|uniref:AI-2E family transporter n=1 Tax=Antarcticibacterium sp. 1MA-6-2 TaxID=2908210 RepID=UPI001F3FDC8B|nr:AI-2E family transporter [Antarcticibacterium sp. 1MA-6-2]UJH92011.1 AI-2E family transporter [Antarcticibacterium sp. 1MA-6-2]
MKGSLQHANSILLFCFLIIAALWFGASIFIPITFAVFFSTLLVPVSNFLEQKGWGRISSSFISTFLLFLGIGIIFFFIIRQLGIFVNDLVEKKEEIGGYILVLQEKVVYLTGYSLQEQEEIFQGRLAEILDFVQNFVSNLLADFTGITLKFLLVLIYIFLLLINRDKFVQFIMMYVPKEKKEETREILGQTQKIAHKYLWGRLQVMLLLGVMYTITFFGYDLPHALLLIIFGMVITVIPYVGPFISGLLPILFMIIFGGSTLEIVSFTIIVIIIQLIESYVLELIIGSEVQQSPLFVIIAVIIGGALWGAAGLILFVPLFGILKILFDHTQDLKPLGFLIGYARPGAKETFLDKIIKKLKK